MSFRNSLSNFAQTQSILAHFEEQLSELPIADREHFTPDLQLLKSQLENQEHRLDEYSQRIAQLEHPHEDSPQFAIEFLDSINDAFYAVDASWRLTFVNQRIANWWRRSRESLIGAVLWDIIPDHEQTEGYRQHLRAMQERIPVHFEILSSNSMTWLDTSIYPSSNGGLSVYIQDITERKRAEEALKETGHKFFHIFNKTAFAASLSRLQDGSLIYLNEAWEKLFGYTRQEALGKTTFELGINPEQDTRVRILAQLRAGGAVRDEEFVLNTKSGERRTLSVNIDLIEIDGEDCILNTAQDITERKRVEEELLKSRQEIGKLAERFKDVLENSQDGPYRRDLRVDRYDYISPAVEGIMGFTAEEMMGMSTDEVLERIHPNDRLMIEETLAQAVEDGAGKLEYRFKCKDGSERWIGDHVTITKDVEGKPLYRTGVIRDITGRKLGEESLKKALAQAEEGRLLLEALMKNIPEGIIITGGPPDFIIEKASRYGLEMTRNPEHEKLIGLKTGQHQIAWDLYLSDAKTRPSKEQLPLYRACKFGEAVQNEEFVIRTKDGEKLPVLVNAVPIRDGQGRIVAGINTWRDIAERKRTESEIRRQNAILAGINRIFHQAITKESEEKLGMLCLEVSEEIAQGRFGFIAEINPLTGSLDYIAMSDPGWDDCRMGIQKPDSQSIQIGFDIHGLYGRVLQDGKGFYTNDPSSHPDSIGVPPGHPKLTSFLGVPLFQGGKLFGMVGLGNREDGFTVETLEALEALAPAITQALLSKRAEEALRESEERERERANEMEALMDAVPAMIWISHEPDCREITGNRYVYDLLRMHQGTNISKSNPDQESANHHYQLVKNGEIVPMSKLPLQAAASSGKPQADSTIDILLTDGTLYHLMGNVNPLFDRKGKPAGAVGAFMDITELRRLEAEKIRAQADIEVQRRLMDQREQERLGIARDLHDGPIQTLSSTVFYLQAIKELFPDPALHVELNQVGMYIREVMRGLRALLYDLRPPTLMHFGFSRIIHVSLEEFHERNPEIELEIDVMDDERQLPDETRLALFRIFKAGMDNIVRHSECNPGFRYI